MISTKQFYFLLTLVLFTLFLRDLPYLNVIFISRMWLVYFALLFFVVLSILKFRVIFLWYGIFILLSIAGMLTIMHLPFFSESIGILIYFSFWTIIIHKFIGFVKGKKE